MKKIKPWRYILGLGLPILLASGFFLQDVFKRDRQGEEVGIYNIDVLSEESGPVIEFEVVNKSDSEKKIDSLSVDIDSLIGSKLDSLEISEPIVIEPESKRSYRLEWGSEVGSRGWMWAKVSLKDSQPYKKLAWYLPHVDWTSPASIAAILPIFGYFLLRKTFFT